MFVHLGGDICVMDSEISAIINLETCPAGGKDMSEFIKAEEESMRIENIVGDLPKTLVLTRDKTYVSPISNTVLLKRLNNTSFSDLM